VAIDWVTKNIYWTDGLYRIIGVKSPESTHMESTHVIYDVWKAIVDRDLSSPQDVAVDPLDQ